MAFKLNIPLVEIYIISNYSNNPMMESMGREQF